MSKTKKSFGKKPRIDKEAVERAFIDWLLGSSLRELQEKYGFHHNTYWYQFRKYYGKDYASIPRCNKGVVAIIREFLSNKKISNKDRASIKEFLEINKHMIVQIDLANTDNPLYTYKEIRNLTWKECSQTENSYDYLFENIEMAEEDDDEDYYDPSYFPIDELEDYVEEEDYDIEVIEFEQLLAPIKRELRLPLEIRQRELLPIEN